MGISRLCISLRSCSMCGRSMVLVETWSKTNAFSSHPQEVLMVAIKLRGIFVRPFVHAQIIVHLNSVSWVRHQSMRMRWRQAWIKSRLVPREAGFRFTRGSGVRQRACGGYRAEAARGVVGFQGLSGPNRTGFDVALELWMNTILRGLARNIWTCGQSKLRC